MTIQLPNYKPVFPNTIYSRTGLLLQKEKIPSIETERDYLPLTEIITLAHYTTPTENDVINYLQEKTTKLTSTSKLILPKNTKRENHSQLEQALIALPSEIFEQIKTGNENLIKFIRQKTPATNTPEHYLNITYGTLPDDLIKTNLSKGTIQSAEWYDTALSSSNLQKIGLGKQLQMRLTLTDGIPEENDLYTLIKHGVHESHILTTSPKFYSQTEAQQLISTIYKSNTFENIQNLPNKTSEVLEEITLQPIIALHKSIKQHAISQAIITQQQKFFK